MEALLSELILATAILSLVVALSVEAFVKPLILRYVADEKLHAWLTNIAALLFGIGLSYLGEFILEMLGAPQYIARAGLQGLVAALGATFGYEVWKNIGRARANG